MSATLPNQTEDPPLTPPITSPLSPPKGRALDRDTLDAMFGSSPDAVMVEQIDPPIKLSKAAPEHASFGDIVYFNSAAAKIMKQLGVPEPTGGDGHGMRATLTKLVDDGFKRQWYRRLHQRIDNLQLAEHASTDDFADLRLMLSSMPIIRDGYVEGCWSRITDASAAFVHDAAEQRALRQINAFVRTENVPLICLAFKPPLPAVVTGGELQRAYRQSTVTHITDSAAALFGKRPDQVLQRTVAAVLSQPIIRLLLNAFPKTSSDEPLTLGDATELTIDVGTQTPMVYRVKPTFVFDNNKAIEAWMRIEDVTNQELRQRQKKINDQTRELAMAAASLIQFEVRVENDTLKLKVDGLEQLGLMPLPETLQDWQDFLTPDRLNTTEQEISDLFAGRTSEIHYIFQMPNIRGDDSFIEVWGLVNPDMGPNRPKHTLGLLRDVTKSQRLNARLSEKKTLEGLGVLAGGVAHDFNNLLMSVLGYAELMEADLLQSAADSNSKPQNQQGALQNINEIRSAALRASELCTSLLAYAGQHLVEKKPIDLTELVRSLSELLEVTIGKRVPLLLNLGNSVEISADNGQLTQVIINLIGNAADAMEGQEGGINLGVTTLNLDPDEQLLLADQLENPAARMACITVRDSGIGMDKETQQRIFEPFFTTKPEGRGLGMAAVHGIVKHHGGAILLNSAPRLGTEFRVFLPLPERSPVPTVEFPSDSPAASPSLIEPMVLVVDDEEGVRTIAAEMLRHLNCEVLLADSAASALELIAQHSVDFALIDITMPVMSGSELAALLLERWPDLTVVLCSGYTEKDVPEALLARCAFIHKPYTLKEMSDTLKLESVMGDQAVLGKLPS